ncbi:L,D-transpeptidase family protein [Cohaesibacter celericrescens]|uniref:Peptidoglycan-binding protein n=1 Tax=Cohaesibacter celericrescens TaxID=2067669 RepID=A0A2N5XLE1_9HYPH|nr:L,D-transpeptidase family protein [Cohaesibacter celericrescens]PLW75257.1 peptidoglycan-binding protein [Cohaesibacter celericrescens]
MMMRTTTALMAILIAATGTAMAASQPSLSSREPIELFGHSPETALRPEIEARSRINQILNNMARVDTHGVDQLADQDTFDALKDAIGSIPHTKNFLQKRDNAALVAFYSDRDFQTAWFENGAWTKQARKLIFALSRVDQDGLNPADYETPLLSIARNKGASAQDIALADIKLSIALTRYTRHAYAGRVDPRSFSKKEVTVKPHYPDSIEALNSIATASDPVALMRSYNPPLKGFVQLREEYNRLRMAKKAETTPPIPDGKSMKAGMQDARVPLLRKKLELPEALENPTLYSKELAKEVKAFQADNGLIADGIAGKATLRILNDNRKDLLADIVANMERWRWLPRDLGDFHVMVNIPTYHVQVMNGDQKLHETRVVVGKSSNKTPVFSDQMEYLVVNPYWNIPRSIATKELLPQIKSDPSAFFSKRNYQVLASVKGRTQVVDPSLLDWDKVDAKQVRLRQPPGTRNALGNIKFIFPNQHAVYLHDTPSRSLFNRDYRAFSHGCVRVQNPMDFAEIILSQTKNWNANRVKKMIGGNERRVNLSKKIPVHLVYFTTWMSDTGTLQIRSDIYGHNAKVKKALNL